jgi:alkylhydroperoxidase family enzyme
MRPFATIPVVLRRPLMMGWVRYGVGTLTLLIAVVASSQETARPRLPLVDPFTQDPVLRPIFDGMRSRGLEPLNIHRTIGHAPELYKAFAGLATALRFSGVTPRVDRELMILRTAQLKEGDYEFAHHRRIGLTCGLTEAQIDRLPSWRRTSIFNERQRAILAYAEKMVQAGDVDDATFATMQHLFSPQEIVELTMTSGFYVGIAQFSRALRIEMDKSPTTYANC